MSETPITQDDRDVSYVAVEGQTEFSVTYKFQADSDLIVSIVSENSNETVLRLNVDYSVSGAGDDTGGTVSLLVGAVEGTEYRIRGEATPELFQRLTSANYSPSTINSIFERCLIWIVETTRTARTISENFETLVTETWPSWIEERISPALAAMGISETNAEISAANAATSEERAGASQNAAATSASKAATSETNAAISAANAATSQKNAATSAASAATSKENAGASQSAAATSASNAATSETNAATSAANAATSEKNAAISEANASSYKTATEAAKDQALAAFASFQDRYLGESATEPTLDLDGTPLDGGELYFDKVSSAMKVYNGSQWVNAYISAAGVLLTSSNLSDLPNKDTARTNLEVYSKAEIATALADYYSKVAADVAFLGKTATAANATKLGGHLASYFAAAANYFDKATSDGRYLGKTAKAADSDKLDGKDSSAFALKSDLNSVIPAMYTGTDKFNLEYPQGSVFSMSYIGNSQYSLNQPITVYLTHGYPVASFLANTSRVQGADPGTPLNGTWVTRGMGSNSVLVQRIA